MLEFKVGVYMDMRITLLIAVGLLVTACDSGLNQNGEINSSQKQDAIYIQMSETNKQELLKQSLSIKLHDKWIDVHKKLGNPDVEKELVPKKTNDKIGTVRTYYVVKLDKELVNEKTDQSLRLYFNKEDELIEIISNISGFVRNEIAK